MHHPFQKKKRPQMFSHDYKACGYRGEISISLHWQFDNGIEALHFVGICDYTEANHCAAQPFAHSS